MILRRLVVGPLQENCYLIAAEESKEGIVIDPGDDAPFILEQTQRLGLTLRWIVNTHAHSDHIGAIAAVRHATGAPFALHRDEIGVLEERLTKQPPWMRDPLEPISPDMLLEDGQTVEVNGVSLKVLHTPGHTPGGICLWAEGILQGQGVVFTGDTLFYGSVGRTDLPGGNWNQLIKSIHSKLMVLPDDTLVLPGHGPETSIGQERQENPFLRGFITLP